MTFIPILDPDIAKMYLHTKNEVSVWNGSKVITWIVSKHRRTDTQTDTNTSMTENINKKYAFQITFLWIITRQWSCWKVMVSVAFCLSFCSQRGPAIRLQCPWICVETPKICSNLFYLDVAAQQTPPLTWSNLFIMKHVWCTSGPLGSLLFIFKQQ